MPDMVFLLALEAPASVFCPIGVARSKNNPAFHDQTVYDLMTISSPPSTRFGGEHGAIVNRHDPIVVSMQDQRR
jgi:hypothetical protein